jgi:CheY-like chemotaxis protein
MLPQTGTVANRYPLRILLCDDNVINQKVALRLLQQVGYRADVAANGVEALAALDRQHYDLVFMDVMMPQMNGFEATRRIRERQRQSEWLNRKVPVIVAMTASAMQGDRERCIASGMDDFLAKPVRMEDVRAIMERWGAGKRPAATTAPGSGGEAMQAEDSPAGRSEPDWPRRSQEAAPPFDMERFINLTDGSAAGIRDLANLFLTQTAKEIEQLSAAIQAGKPEETRRLAHSCAGASGTCGMDRLARLLRELEQQAGRGDLTNAVELEQGIKAEYAAVCRFFEAGLAGPSAPSGKSGA